MVLAGGGYGWMGMYSVSIQLLNKICWAILWASRCRFPGTCGLPSYISSCEPLHT